MTPAQVLEHFGPTQEQAARAIGVTQGAISQWCVRGFIPLSRQYQLQVATAGRLVADPANAPKRKPRRKQIVSTEE